MSVTYEVKLLSPTGVSLSQLVPNANMRWAVGEMAVGALTIKIPGGMVSHNSIIPDGRIELWRKIDGGWPMLVGGQWIIKGIGLSGNAEDITIEAQTFNSILNDRIIDYNASTKETTNAYSDKTGAADNVIKAFVRENIGATATDTTRALSGLTVTPDLSLAPSVTKEASRKVLLSTLQDIAMHSRQLGTYLTFGWIFDGNLFTFDTRVIAWGANHGSTSGNKLIISRERGNLLEPAIFEDYSEEKTVIKIGGSGTGADRVIGTATNSDRLAVSPFSRKEYFSSGYNTDESATLTAEANAKLQEYKARRVFTGKLAETEKMRFGVHVNFGDLVMAEYAGKSYDVHLDTISAEVRGGIEVNLDMRLRGEEII